MTVEELCHIAAASDSHRLSVIEVERAAAETGLSISDLLDRVARTIAEQYSSGAFDFSFCDAVMNAMFGFVHAPDSVERWSPFAQGVFEAFDQGEYRGEAVTKCLLDLVLSRGYLKPGDCSEPTK